MPQPDTPSQDEVAYWSEKYGRPLTAAEVADINRNLVEFMELLAEWENRNDDR
jgi:hypothetical protein